MYFFSDDFALYPFAVRKFQTSIIASPISLLPDDLAYYFTEKTKMVRRVSLPSINSANFHLSSYTLPFLFYMIYCPCSYLGITLILHARSYPHFIYSSTVILYLSSTFWLNRNAYVISCIIFLKTLSLIPHLLWPFILLFLFPWLLLSLEPYSNQAFDLIIPQKPFLSRWPITSTLPKTYCWFLNVI